MVITVSELTNAGVRIVAVERCEDYQVTLMEQKKRAQGQFNRALVEMAAIDAKLETVAVAHATWQRHLQKPLSE